MPKRVDVDVLLEGSAADSLVLKKRIQRDPERQWWRSMVQVAGSFERSAHKAAHEDAWATLWAATVQLAPEDTDVIRKRLAEVVQGAFSEGTASGDLDARVRFLEQRVEALRGQLASLTKVDKLEAVREASLLVLDSMDDIRDSFEQSFGLASGRVSIVPSEDDDHVVAVIFDLTKENRQTIASARSGGARGRFYELVLKRLSPQTFRMVEFQFLFPS